MSLVPGMSRSKAEKFMCSTWPYRLMLRQSLRGGTAGRDAIEWQPSVRQGWGHVTAIDLDLELLQVLVHPPAAS